MITTILSLGTNRGDRNAYIRAMRAHLEQVMLPPVTYSPLMETEPVGVSGEQTWFYNVIMKGTFAGTPKSLLTACQEIEILLGRDRKGMLKPRTADIDILCIDDCVIDEAGLIVPHSQILNRRFCIEGIYAVAPQWVYPITGVTFEVLHRNMGTDIQDQKIHFI